MNSSINKDKKLKEVLLSEINFQDSTFRSRKNLEIDDLKESLKQDGQQVPVELRELNGKYQIICGFRRCNALKSIGSKIVLAFVHASEKDELYLHKVSLCENLQRATLTDLEKIDACASLKKKGMSKKELARIYNVGTRTIENYIRISIKAPEILRSVISEGIMTIHQASPLIGKDDKIIKQAIEQAKKGKLSVNRAKKLSNKRTKESYRKPMNRIKKFKKGFNLYIRFRNDYDEKIQRDIKKTLLDAIDLIENSY